MKFILVSPPPRRIIQPHDMTTIPPLGLGYLGSYLREMEIECTVLSAKSHRLSIETMIGKILSGGFDGVGISAMTHEMPQASQLAAKIRKRRKAGFLILGGTHATVLPEGTARTYPAFDAVIFGEGENTLVECVTRISSGRNLENVRGVVWRRPEGVVKNSAREWIQDLDRLPFPCWDAFPKSTLYPILASRGCPYRCIFCCRSLGNKVRYRNPENVAEEMEWLATNFQPRFIDFYDESFGASKQRTRQLLEIILQKGFTQKVKISAQTRIGLLDMEMFNLMKKAGFYKIDFGVESGNDKILSEIKKGITLEKTRETVKMAKQAGLKTCANFILGHPGETRRTAWDTLHFAAELNPTYLSLGIMVPYPGTELYEMAVRGEKGLAVPSSRWESYDRYFGDVEILTHMPMRRLERLQFYGYLIFYLRNRRFLGLFRFVLGNLRSAFRFGLRLLGRA